ncbi:MAG: metal ABC transporter substrate-binding protein [Verrucomicrobia bacterium]|nr:metal ABC transporter substrate-binding protein [Verrucomicrobiota bacterium]
MNGPLYHLLALLLGLLSVLGAPAAEIRVLTTLPAIHSWAANVAGDTAAVESLLPANVGPHDFQFRPSDLRKLAAADVVLMNGLGVDTWLTRAVSRGASKPSRRVVTVTDGLQNQLIHHRTPLAIDPTTTGSKKPSQDHSHDHDHGDDDANPHIWLDPVFAKHCVSNIIQALCQADPAHAEGYTRRGETYLRELDQLDEQIRSSLKGLSNRKVVTFHDAFPYFCRRYDLQLVGVVEEVPSVDPSPKYLAQLSRAIRQQQVRVIFSEPQFHPRLIKRLANDLAIGVAELDVLETGVASRTFYVDGLRRNLRTLELALH